MRIKISEPRPKLIGLKSLKTIINFFSNYEETETRSESFDVKASQSIAEEMSYFDLDGSLKMSFMSGLVRIFIKSFYYKSQMFLIISLVYRSEKF